MNKIENISHRQEPTHQAIEKLAKLKELPGFQHIICERYYYNFLSNITITHFLDNITDNSWLIINIDKEKKEFIEMIKINELTQCRSSQPITNYDDIFRLKDYSGKGQSIYIANDTIKYENVILEFDKGRKIKIIGGTRYDCENQNIFKETLDDILVRKIYKPILIQ